MVFSLLLVTVVSFGQTWKDSVVTALLHDDSVGFATLINKDSINRCFPDPGSNYSLLSQAVRMGATRCFNLLIQYGADPNTRCNGYVPPLMHAAKYGRLYMVKVLIAKGADPNFIYQGDYTPANGMTPLMYAQEYKQAEIVEYLQSLKSSTH
jgi:ankyrin repeat protein